MACQLNRENVTISIIQYASDQLEDTGLFTNVGGNILNTNSGFLTLEGDVIEGTPVINEVDGIETIHINTGDGLELVRRPQYQEAVDVVNSQFQVSVVGYDEDSNTATIWPPDEVVDGYLPQEGISQEHLAAIQEINETVGEEVLEVDDNGDIVINEISSNTDLDFETSPQAPPPPTQTKAWVRGFLDRVGVKVEQLNDIVINGERMGANAVALPLQALVLHTQDGEVNLTEEAMHIAVELLSQKNPKLYKELMDNIESTEGYQEVFDQYENDTQYQNKDNTPNLTKIKKEAIGKLLAQTVISQKQNKTVASWWSRIIDFFKGLFGTSGNNLTLLTKAVDTILQEDLGTIRDTLLQNQAYLQEQGISQEMIPQISNLAQSDLTDEELRIAIAQIIPPIIFKHSLTTAAQRIDQIIEKNSNTVSTDANGDHTINGKRANSGNSQATQLNKSVEHTKVQDKIEDKQNSTTHKAVIASIKKFTDGDGFLDTTNKSAQTPIEANVLERMETFPATTKFYANQSIAHQGKVFTIDFLAVEPDGRTSILQFDEVSVEDPTTEKIPTYETNAYRAVLNAQIQALKSLGVSKFGMTRVIPINSNKDTQGNVTITIGDVKVINKDLFYLSPIPSQSETTGNIALDSFIAGLNSLYTKISNKTVSEAQRLAQMRQLTSIVQGVRGIQVRKDLKPIVRQAYQIRDKMESLVAAYDATIENLDVEDPKNKKVLDDFASDVAMTLQIADTYQDLGTQFRKVPEHIRKEFNVPMVDLDKVSNKVKDEYNLLMERNAELMNRVAEKNLGVQGLTAPEKVVNYISSRFRTLSQQSTAALQSLYRMVFLANQATDIELASRTEQVKSLKDRYIKWMEAHGLSTKTMHSYLVKKDSNDLIDQTQKQFYQDLFKAQEANDQTWLDNNIDVQQYNLDFNKRKTETFREIDATVYALDPDRNNELQEEAREAFLNTYDLSRGVSKFNTLLKNYPLSKWNTAEYTFLKKKGNEPLSDLYEAFISRNKEAVELGVIRPDQARNFLISVRKDWAEKLVFGGSTKIGEGFLRDLTINPQDTSQGQLDEHGNLLNKVPFYFTHDQSTKNADGTRDYTNISTDLFKNLNLFDHQILRYKNITQIEKYVDLIGRVEKSKSALATNIFGDRIQGGSEINNIDNYRLFEKFVAGAIYGHRNVDSQLDMKLGKVVGKGAKWANKVLGSQVFTEDYTDNIIPLSRAIDAANKWFAVKVLGLNLPVTIANYMGTNITALIQSGKWFTRAEFLSMEFGILTGKISNNKDVKHIAILDYFLPLLEGENTKIKGRQLNMSKINSMTITERLMSPMAISDRPTQWAIAGAYIKNAMIKDGKLVNIREYLTETMLQGLYTPGAFTQQERREKVRQFEEMVKTYQDTRSLLATATIVNDQIVIQDDQGNIMERDNQEVLKFREKMQQITRNATGMGNEQDFRLINKTLVGRSLMMFKSWIPRLVDQRFGELRYVKGTDSFEMGRARALGGLLSLNLVKATRDVTDILTLTDRGVQLLADKYEEAKEKWEFENPGKEFTMTQDQYTEMYSKLIGQSLIELGSWAALASMFFLLFSLGDDDDYDDPRAKGAIVYAQRIMDKVINELSFFYKPTEWISMANGNMFPALSIVSDLTKVTSNLSKQIFGYATGDEEAMEKAKPAKFILKSLPLTKWTTPFMALFLDEAQQKDWGITHQSELAIVKSR